MAQTKAEFYDIKNNAKINTQAFIDGQFCDAADQAVLETINPATNEVIAAFASCGSADVDRAVAAARRVFDQGTWSRSAPEYRKEKLCRLAGLIRAIQFMRT